MRQLLKKPLISEKNSMMAENGIYAFVVDKTATKTEVKNAVEKMFRVKVIAIRTSICRDRATRNKMGSSSVKYWKKAMVRLAPGQKIAIFEGG
ncbi:MAG: 50S ribosomal protein L23 [Bdellovibrionales bacterium RBG_16_40_8]|nr:MAG: 50S ribosomal protein L23 [Bdellovibrionales bacterium RBG_16_40_8]